MAGQVEGREVSDSEEEDEDEEEDDYGAQDAAVLAAQMDGATVEHISSSKAAGNCLNLLDSRTRCIEAVTLVRMFRRPLLHLLAAKHSIAAEHSSSKQAAGCF